MAMTIVYTSNTGHTEEYAKLLGQETGLEVRELKEAAGTLPANSEIIYLGWLRASEVVGYKKAAKKFNVKCLCGVGMLNGQSQVPDIRKVNKVGTEFPVFCLPGGFDPDKVHGFYRFAMKLLKKNTEAELKGKADPEKTGMLEMLSEGGNLVSADHLKELLVWCKG